MSRSRRSGSGLDVTHRGDVGIGICGCRACRCQGAVAAAARATRAARCDRHALLPLTVTAASVCAPPKRARVRRPWSKGRPGDDPRGMFSPGDGHGHSLLCRGSSGLLSGCGSRRQGKGGGCHGCPGRRSGRGCCEAHGGDGGRRWQRRCTIGAAVSAETSVTTRLGLGGSRSGRGRALCRRLGGRPGAACPGWWGRLSCAAGRGACLPLPRHISTPLFCSGQCKRQWKVTASLMMTSAEVRSVDGRL